MTMKKLLMAALALTTVTCAGALMTAPPGSSLTLSANPDSVASNGGISVLTAFVIEPAGTTVPDGTVVQFFTNLGRVDPREAKTKNGVAFANFVSDARSGTATITAVSGGAAVAPAPSPSASPGPQPITAAATAQTQIRIGAVLPARVIVTADPSRITTSRSTHIFATVLDLNGNPVPNVGVIFTVNTPNEFMDSEGPPFFTDTNGRAADVLRTRSTVPTVVTVNVTVLSSGNVSGAVTVPILLQ
jgi:hypothetical protein